MPYNQEVFSQYAVGRMNDAASDYRALAERVARIERLLLLMVARDYDEKIYESMEAIDLKNGVPSWVKKP